MRKFVRVSLCAALAAFAAGAGVYARQAASTGPAKELATLLTSAKTDCVFAKVPSDTGRYVAALNVAGVQMLVVSAKFNDQTAMEYRAYTKDCMGAYADLNSAADAQERIIIEDMGADGLVALPKKDAPRDGVNRSGKTMKLDGDPKLLKKEKIAPEVFDKTFHEADEMYVHWLRLLLSELKK
jgi:hypothetical protein